MTSTGCSARLLESLIIDLVLLVRLNKGCTVSLQAGSTAFDKFEILELIGSGGMATVYKARHIHLDKTVVLKIMKTTSKSGLVRFHQEAKILSKLEHPHISRIFDFGLSANNEPFLALEYLEGDTLTEILKRKNSLEPELAVRLIAQICDALIYIHEIGVIHRDVKPGNIIVQDIEQTPKALLLDFGIAKLLTEGEDQSQTPSGVPIGTPAYMSPEQADGQIANKKMDQYSLGCVLFEAIAGAPPLAGDSPIETLRLRQQNAPPLVSSVASNTVPEMLDRILLRLLDRNPENRFESLETLKAELTAVEADLNSAEEAKTDVEQKPHEQQSIPKKKLSLNVLVSVLLIGGMIIALVAIRSNKNSLPVLSIDKKSRPSETLILDMTNLPDQNPENQKRQYRLTFPRGIKPSTLSILRDYPHLQVLKVRFEQPASFSDLQNLTHTDKLVVLHIRGELKPGASKALSKLRFLRILHLRDSNFGDSDIDNIKSLPMLDTLDIVNTKVTPKGLAKLGNSYNLSRVNMSADLFASREREQLFKKLPDCSFGQVESRKVETVLGPKWKYVHTGPGQDSKIQELQHSVRAKISKDPENVQNQKMYEFFKDCLRLTRQPDNKPTAKTAKYLINMAIRKDALGNRKAAMRLLRKAETIAVNTRDYARLCDCKIHEANVLWQSGQYDKSLKLTSEAIALRKQTEVVSTSEVCLQLYQQLIARYINRKLYSKAAATADELVSFIDESRSGKDKRALVLGVPLLDALRANIVLASLDSTKTEHARKQCQYCIDWFNSRREDMIALQPIELKIHIEALLRLASISDSRKEKAKLSRESAKWFSHYVSQKGIQDLMYGRHIVDLTNGISDLPRTTRIKFKRSLVKLLVENGLDSEAAEKDRELYQMLRKDRKARPQTE